MSNQTPYLGPIGDGDDDETVDDQTLADVLGEDDDRPLDPDLDGDQVESAAADQRAATEGEIDVDELP